MLAPTIFRLLIVRFKVHFDLDGSDGHNLSRQIWNSWAHIDGLAEKLRTLCARRMVSGPTTDKPIWSNFPSFTISLRKPACCSIEYFGSSLPGWNRSSLFVPRRALMLASTLLRRFFRLPSGISTPGTEPPLTERNVRSA